MDKNISPPKVGLDYSQTEAIKCEECDSEVFQPAMVLRRVSALLSPTGKETVLPVQLFSCVKCGHVNKDMYPR